MSSIEFLYSTFYQPKTDGSPTEIVFFAPLVGEGRQKNVVYPRSRTISRENLH